MEKQLIETVVMSNTVAIEIITEKIFEIRGQKVMVDVDLANLYGVPTKRLNEAVKRNIQRFPPDLMFQLEKKEWIELVANCDRFANMKHSSALPHVFTETGVAMLSSVLNSETAIQINLQIIRAFIRLRRMLTDHEALRLAIEGLEMRMSKNERDIQIAIKAIQAILAPPQPKSKKLRMGFAPPEKAVVKKISNVEVTEKEKPNKKRSDLNI